MPRGATQSQAAMGAEPGPSSSRAEEDIAAGYRHAFLQYIMHRGWMLESDAHSFVRQFSTGMA